MASMHMGPLIILSGPAGIGKTTLIERLLTRGGLPLRLAVSATTRSRRDGEREGFHYWFWTREQFQSAIRNDAFLEWAEVHGQYYGTLRQEVEPYRTQGVGVILDIDVQGADQVRRKCPDVVTIFLHPPAWETLEERLRKRGTETEASIQRRLATARQELARAADYDWQVVNDDLDRALAELRAIVQQQFSEE
jgi:guanylate kinase